MKRTCSVITLIVAASLLGMLATSQVAGQATQPVGKLILWGDIAVFQPPPHPENCTVKNRFKRGEPVGFRLYALDGGTKPVRAHQWTAKWKVPNDAPTGTVHYSATARDRFGRTAEWTPQGGEPSWVTIVQ